MPDDSHVLAYSLSLAYRNTLAFVHVAPIRGCGLVRKGETNIRQYKIKYRITAKMKR